MKTQESPVILYLEDDWPAVADHVGALRDKGYEVEVDASWDVINRGRKPPPDLLILDVMIHPRHFRDKTQKEVKSISFDGIEWKRSGLQFLRFLRQGKYADSGLRADMPVVVVTAVADRDVTDEVTNKLNVFARVEKPCTVSQLVDVVGRALRQKQAE